MHGVGRSRTEAVDVQDDAFGTAFDEQSAMRENIGALPGCENAVGVAHVEIRERQGEGVGDSSGRGSLRSRAGAAPWR